MVSIYGIEDINDNIYVGSTIQKLNRRLSVHRAHKRYNIYCSSSKLNLDYCIIYELERCNEEDRKEREQYWIDKLDCVNDYKLNFSHKEWIYNNREIIQEYQKTYQKTYKEKNKNIIKENNRIYYLKNKEKLNKKRLENYHKKKQENTK
tara:strand:+ start:430 stop:876 length:447 start_codon:yes stop_codon:yes gene_type:complete